MDSGGSGSGKSSVNALLLRYYDPINGKVTYDGQGKCFDSGSKAFQDSRLLDIREFKPASWRSVIGVVPQVCLLPCLIHKGRLERRSSQDPVLFTGTIASNIAYGNEGATREQIEAAARQANCEFVYGMPKGFDTESKLLVVLI